MLLILNTFICKPVREAHGGKANYSASMIKCMYSRLMSLTLVCHLVY